jgi:transcriptional regulator with XRE-family HTH domain
MNRYIGRALRKLREDHGLSQQHLADKMHTARTTISSIEMDVCQPTLGHLWAMEEVLGLPHGELTRLSYPEAERLPRESRRRGRPKLTRDR